MILESFLSNRDALMQRAAEEIAAALCEGLKRRGSACAALSGGSTPGPAYERLAAMQLDWPRITFALVDERCVPTTDPASNEYLIRRTLATALAAGARFLPMYFGTPSSDRAEAAYRNTHIDIALMGMGADGHTASWFPGGDRLAATLNPASPRTVVNTRAPQAVGAADRLTLSRAAIDRAGRVLLLFTGEDKRLRLETALTQRIDDAPVAALFARPGSRPTRVLWAP